MVEVFKTNVKSCSLAHILIEQIHDKFPTYSANFDLDDCDKILRVECAAGFIESSLLINLFKDFGYIAEILPDDEQMNCRIDNPYALFN